MGTWCAAVPISGAPLHPCPTTSRQVGNGIGVWHLPHSRFLTLIRKYDIASGTTASNKCNPGLATTYDRTGRYLFRVAATVAGQVLT
jgi:hypothetical protein